jgi:putative aminopeptidase FrvX
MRPGFTLNYGVRWEVDFPWTPLNNAFTWATPEDVWGPSGVNSLFKKRVEGYADEVVTDKLGSVAFLTKGSSDRLKILVAGHTDEVGFIVSSITDEGYLTFHRARRLGGIRSSSVTGL